MSLIQKFDEDLKSALKARETLKVSVLRMTKAAAMQAAIQKGKPALEDSEIHEVIVKLIKQREESVEAFKKGGRAELAQKEAQEIDILKGYLPPALSEEELKQIVLSAVKELGAGGPAAMGSVMKAVMPKVAGRADGSKISQMVKEILGK